MMAKTRRLLAGPLLAVAIASSLVAASAPGEQLAEALPAVAAGDSGSDDTFQFTRLYKITWNGPLKEGNQLDEDDANVIHIATKQNERYACVVPSDSRNQLNFDTSAKNTSSQENKTKTPIQLLEPLLKGNYCSYKFELFWIYELCHGKFLRQYHEENAKYKAKVTQEYYLGRMEQEQAIEAHEQEYERQMKELEQTGQQKPTILVNGHYKPFIRFNMTSGTKCDLTKNSRVAKIIYVCNEEPSLELYSIKEISTCEYEAIVLSPHLCQHKDFKVDTTTMYEIQCYAKDGAPRRPKKTLDFEVPEEEDDERTQEGRLKKRPALYVQGRTLIIDADLLLSR